MKKITFAVLALVLFTLLFSCSGGQSIVLNSDLSGSSKTSIELMDFMTLYYEDLSMALTGKNEEHIFDIEAIRSQIKDKSGITSYTVTEAAVNKLTIETKFSNILTLFDKLKTKNPVFSVTENSGVVTLKFRLDRTNIAAVLDQMPASMKEDNILLPDPDNPLSENEYLELLVYILEDYGPADIEEKLRAAKLDFSLTVPGTIKSVTGCVAVGNTVKASLPMLKLLSLENPVEMTVSFVK